MNAPTTAVQAIAPTGVLRASINLGNPVLATRELISMQPVGISVDLAHRLGHCLGVPVNLVVCEAASKSVDAVSQGHADIGFFAIDPLRGEDINFTLPYVVIEGGYLVPDTSTIHSLEEVDRADHRVVVGRGSAYDLFLSRALKHAEIVRSATPSGVMPLFTTQKLEVAAGIKTQLKADAKRIPGLRLLPGCFMLIQQAMGLSKNRTAEGVEFLSTFVEEAKATGFIADALARHQIEGCSVPPACT